MFLQILPADKETLLDTILENQLLFVVLGLTIGVFLILRIAKMLSKIRLVKVSRKPSYTS